MVYEVGVRRKVRGSRARTVESIAERQRPRLRLVWYYSLLAVVDVYGFTSLFILLFRRAHTTIYNDNLRASRGCCTDI